MRLTNVCNMDERNMHDGGQNAFFEKNDFAVVQAACFPGLGEYYGANHLIVQLP